MKLLKLVQITILSVTLAVNTTVHASTTQDSAKTLNQEQQSVGQEIAEIIVKGTIGYVTAPIWLTAGYAAGFVLWYSIPVLVPAAIIFQEGGRIHKYQAYPILQQQLAGQKLQVSDLAKEGADGVDIQKINQQLAIVADIFKNISDEKYIDFYSEFEYDKIAKRKDWTRPKTWDGHNSILLIAELKALVPSMKDLSEAEVCAVMDYSKKILKATVDKMVKSWRASSNENLGGGQ